MVERASKKAVRISPDDVNRLFPVTELDFYGKGIIKVKRESMVTSDGNAGGGPRGKIEYLSSRSRSYLAFVVAATEVTFGSLLTLTYGNPYPTDGAICKSHLNAFLTWMRAQHVGLSYVWVTEFQKRGALHFHILLSLGGIEAWHRKDAASRWASITAPANWATNTSEELDTAYRKKSYNVHKHKDQWQDLETADGAMRYMTKYCLKTEQKLVPEFFQNVGRFFGMSRDVVGSARKATTIEIDTEGLQLLLEVEGHQTSGWGVVPRYLFGITLEPDPNLSDD